VAATNKAGDLLNGLLLGPSASAMEVAMTQGLAEVDEAIDVEMHLADQQAEQPASLAVGRAAGKEPERSADAGPAATAEPAAEADTTQTAQAAVPAARAAGDGAAEADATRRLLEATGLADASADASAGKDASAADATPPMEAQADSTAVAPPAPAAGGSPMCGLQEASPDV